MKKIRKDFLSKPRTLLFLLFSTTSLLTACGGSSSDDPVVDIDKVAPSLTLSGETEVTLLLNDTYTDAGASATDNIDGAIDVVTTGSVDTMTAGTYTLTFTATDKAGNVTTLTRTVTVVPPTLTGTAAGGAAIVGTVTIKDALGATRSELIEADGTYSVDVTGLTAPFRLRAEGTVGGKNYKLHSYAEEATLDSTVNITPFTDLIIANAAQQIAEDFFDEAAPTALDPVEIAAQEDALQEKLQSVFDALGLDSAIDLLSTSFSADHSGLDAALDIIKIETDPTTNIATIENILDGSTIEDDVSDTADNDTAIVVDAATITTAVTDTQAIAALFDDFSTLFVDGLPNFDTVEVFFGEDFLHQDEGKNQFLTDITTDPSLIGLAFISLSVRDIDSTAGTAMVDFSVKFNGIVEAGGESWHVKKDDVNGWQLLGNQQFFEADTLTFHCNDWDGTDPTPSGCGLNVSFYDNDFSNNGTNDAPLASATMTITGADGTVKDIVYLGNPTDIGPGELQVYNQTDGAYQWDYAAFGSTEGEVDPSIFAVGDVIKYDLYTEELDLTSATMPAVTGDPLFSFEQTLQFLPETEGRFPALTAEALTAFENFDLESDLDISWTLQEGTVTDSVWVEISDTQGNYFSVEDEALARDATTATIDAAMFAEELRDNLDFDTSEFNVLIRIYSIVPETGQFHSTDYRETFVETSTGGGDGTGTVSLTCDTESPWDDTTDKPTVFYSINDFEAVVADCESSTNLPNFTKAELANVTWYVEDERIVFDATGSSFVLTSYGDDNTLGTNDDETYYGVVSDYATNVIEFAFSATQGGAILGRDLIRIKTEESFENKGVYTAITLWEDYEWTESDGDNSDKAHKGGELFSGAYSVDADFNWDAWYSQ